MRMMKTNETESKSMKSKFLNAEGAMQQEGVTGNKIIKNKIKKIKIQGGLSRDVVYLLGKVLKTMLACSCRQRGLRLQESQRVHQKRVSVHCHKSHQTE